MSTANSLPVASQFGLILRSLTVAASALILVSTSGARAKEIPVDEAIDLPVKVGLAAFEQESPHHWKRIGSGVIQGGEAELDWRAELERAALNPSFDKAGNVDGGKEHEDNEPADGFSRWVAYNVETGEEYLVELPNTYLREIGKAARAAGVNQSNPGPLGDRGSDADDSVLSSQIGPSPGGPANKGWSHGSDTRVRRYTNTWFPYRAMGQIGGGPTSGCTGTLIGSRHVLTAAHCIWNRNTDSWYSFTFRPGREGTCGSATCQPYGAHGAIWYFTPVPFRTASTANSWKYDYGIVTTTGRPGNQTGWMGYVAVGAGTLQTHCNDQNRCKHRGYPACGLSGAPVAYETCKQGWAYQDTDHCEVANFKNQDADGWNQRFDVDCDSSGGHSGGPLFSNHWGQNNARVVFGVASTHICSTCSGSDRWVNTYRRITPEVLDWISYFKTAKFP